MLALHISINKIGTGAKPATIQLAGYIIHPVARLGSNLVEPLILPNYLVGLLRDASTLVNPENGYSCHVPIATHRYTAPKHIKVPIAIQW